MNNECKKSCFFIASIVDELPMAVESVNRKVVESIPFMPKFASEKHNFRKKSCFMCVSSAIQKVVWTRIQREVVNEKQSFYGQRS